jgi:capsular polysaccharide export protein
MRSLDQLLTAQRILMLQGPMGNFFDHVSSWLRERDIECYKVNFNGGDHFFYHGPYAIDYIQPLDHFQGWLGLLIDQLNIDTILCFGDCRLYHVEAKQVCHKKNIQFLVFEEGYLRPDYITLEVDGVNAYSSMNLDKIAPTLSSYHFPIPTDSSFALMVFSACFYYLAWIAMSWRYRHYQHHRLLTPSQEVSAWFRSFRLRVSNSVTDRIRYRYIRQYWSNCYYIVALQVHNDSQVRVHSNYLDVSDFIVETMRSFAAEATPSQCLVIKHHPMDRGYRNYRQLIKELSIELGMSHRVMYVCDVHLPSLIRGSLGLIAINSTTGLQALFHGKPVKVMGRAIYDLPQLTCQKSLDAFWVSPTPVDRDYYSRFRELLIVQSQLNGSFYGGSPWMLLSRSQIPAGKKTPTLAPRPIMVRRHG